MMKTLEEQITEAVTPVVQAQGLNVTGIVSKQKRGGDSYFIVYVSHSTERYSVERDALTRAGRAIGLAGVLDKYVMVGKDVYKIVGYRASSHKYPILAERLDGKVFKLPLYSVKTAWNNGDGRIAAYEGRN